MSKLVTFFVVVTVRRNFFYPIFFPIRLFPSASAIRRYPVRVLQTPSKAYVWSEKRKDLGRECTKPLRICWRAMV